MLFASVVNIKAQTNPTAVSLPFALSSQVSNTLPGGVAVHKFTSIPTTRTLLPATGDLPNQGTSVAGTAGGWYNLSADGIGLLSSGTNAAGAVVVAVNTSGQTNISVSWICKTIKNQASRDNSIALQYRVGTTGNFIDVGTSSVYSSAGTADGTTSSVFTEVLPAGANNQVIVQVRWIYWESVSTSGSRDKISVDNISISSTPTSACAAPSGLAASGVTTSGANLSWSAVSGATSYEYAVLTSATPPASGTNITATSYAASGLTSNMVYYFHVRSVCGAGTFSGWSTLSFTTAATTDTSSEFVVMTYNLLNYPGSTASTREPSYRTIVDSVKPDLLIVQELSDATGIGSFLTNVLNFSSPVYSQGTFINGPDSDNGLYYKSTKFQFISNTPVQTDLRDINQFKLIYIPSGDTIVVFSAHLKSSSTSADEAQRALEVDSLRKVTNAFAAGKYFMVCGDFNIYGSTESAYQKLIGTGSNANGKFNDLLSMTGTWNNAAYAINHTQSPRTTAFGGGATGGLDDRFDMFLFSDGIIQSGGIDIVSNSYKAYGNDGNHYNQALNTPPYAMYSSVTAAAIHDASDHLPVIVKLKYTAPSFKTVGIKDVSPALVQDNVSVYPNPAHTVFFVKVHTAFNTPASFSLYNTTGILLQKATVKGSAGEVVSFDVSAVAPGVYYLRSEELNEVYKIVVE